GIGAHWLWLRVAGSERMEPVSAFSIRLGHRADGPTVCTNRMRNRPFPAKSPAIPRRAVAVRTGSRGGQSLASSAYGRRTRLQPAAANYLLTRHLRRIPGDDMDGLGNVPGGDFRLAVSGHGAWGTPVRTHHSFLRHACPGAFFRRALADDLPVGILEAHS